jgi:hypothetical protein
MGRELNRVGLPRPGVRFPRQQAVDQRNRRWQEGKREQKAVGPVEGELDATGRERDQEGEQESAGARVRRRTRIGDHEEGEDDEGSAHRDLLLSGIASAASPLDTAGPARKTLTDARRLDRLLRSNIETYRTLGIERKLRWGKQ